MGVTGDMNYAFIMYCSLPNPPDWTGPLEPNTVLGKASRLYEGILEGPESIVADGGEFIQHTCFKNRNT